MAAAATVQLLAGADVAVAEPPANAACAGYTYRGKLLIRVPLQTDVRKAVGYAYWYQKNYAHSVSRVCAVTRPTSAHFVRTRGLSVSLETWEAHQWDGGPYRCYTGPVVIARTCGVTLYGEVTLARSAGGRTYTGLVDRLPA